MGGFKVNLKTIYEKIEGTITLYQPTIIQRFEVQVNQIYIISNPLASECYKKPGLLEVYAIQWRYLKQTRFLRFFIPILRDFISLLNMKKNKNKS